MVDIVYPDIVGGFAKGLQIRSAMDDMAAKKAEREREDKIRKSIESVSGDKDPLKNNLFSTLPLDVQNQIRQGIAMDAELSEQQKNQRYNAMFKDFKLAESLLDNGFENEAVELLKDRSTNTGYGQDTQEVLQAYQAGGAPVLKKYLAAFNNLAGAKTLFNPQKYMMTAQRLKY
jgi:hypothetical protein